MGYMNRKWNSELPTIRGHSNRGLEEHEAEAMMGNWTSHLWGSEAYPRTLEWDSSLQKSHLLSGEPVGSSGWCAIWILTALSGALLLWAIPMQFTQGVSLCWHFVSLPVPCQAAGTTREGVGHARAMFSMHKLGRQGRSGGRSDDMVPCHLCWYGLLFLSVLLKDSHEAAMDVPAASGLLHLHCLGLARGGHQGSQHQHIPAHAYRGGRQLASVNTCWPDPDAEPDPIPHGAFSWVSPTPQWWVMGGVRSASLLPAARRVLYIVKHTRTHIINILNKYILPFSISRWEY